MTKEETAETFCQIKGTKLITIDKYGIYHQYPYQEEEGLDRSHFASWIEVLNVVNDWRYFQATGEKRNGD